MPLIQDQYKAPLWLKNGHLNSLYPYFLRKPAIPDYQRQRWTTPDNDFIDVDWLNQGADKLVILSHGLEGSSHSQYILSAAHLFYQNGWDVIAMNHRSCSGELNRQIQMYHSGFTQDLHFIIDRVKESYKQIGLLGYSLGGNMISKYLSDGLYPLAENIIAGVGISVPTHLASGAEELGKWRNAIYTIGFLRTLRPKALMKAKQFPKLLDEQKIKSIKTLIDFDHYITARLHGFEDAFDYYEKSSSLQFLDQLNRPLLMLNAADDPFLGDQCYPTDLAKASDKFHLMISKHGGHVGYVSRSEYYFHEECALNFMNKWN